jgi:hypothetical protein
VRSKVLGAATLFLAFQLLGATSTPAQGPQPATPPEARAPFSGIARHVVTWLHRATHTGTHRHPIASSPPLPRPRPARITNAPELPAPAVEPNRAQSLSTAIEPDKISPAPTPKVERDRAPTEPASSEANELPPTAAAVEFNVESAKRANTVAEPSTPPQDLPAAAVEPSEAQPTAVEPNMISSTPIVEPNKTPAELPAGAVEQTNAPSPTGTVFRGTDIPD